MTSVTERLRALLDERGVEYETYTEPTTGFEHVKWSYGGHGSADFNLEFGEPWLTMYGTISGPAQAIDATLGRGTCHETVIDHYWRGCGSCGYIWEFMYGIGKCERPRYCPNCGRKVVE